MAGHQFSLIDAFYMPLFNLLMNLGFDHLLVEREHLKRWWESVSQRDAWKEAVEPFNKVYGF
jgi:glutathione S-transferase